MNIKIIKRLLRYILKCKLMRIVPDTFFIKMKYYIMFQEKLNFNNPKTFNEKIQWLKLNDYNSWYSEIVDKAQVRKYIEKEIGEEYLIPYIGIYKNFDEIDFNKLPNQFVLKPNHTSGDVFICKDKTRINFYELKKTVKKWLKKNYYWIHREMPYKNIEPCIICEKYLSDDSGDDLKDYKIFCFDGEPKIIQVDYNRFNGHKRNLYNIEWEYLNVEYEYPSKPDNQIKVPNNLNKMLDLAKILSKPFSFVRVDFYLVNGNIYFGELTLYPEAGFGKFYPRSFDKILGDLIKLPNK